MRLAQEPRRMRRKPASTGEYGGGWIRTSVGASQRIYSPSPLATRAPLRSTAPAEACASDGSGRVQAVSLPPVNQHLPIDDERQVARRDRRTTDGRAPPVAQPMRSYCGGRDCGRMRGGRSRQPASQGGRQPRECGKRLMGPPHAPRLFRKAGFARIGGACSLRRQRRRKRSTALTSAVRTPGSSAECPASGTTVRRARGQRAASSKAVSAGQTMS